MIPVEVRARPSVVSRWSRTPLLDFVVEAVSGGTLVGEEIHRLLTFQHEIPPCNSFVKKIVSLARQVTPRFIELE